jgi:diguanylate cyclase
MLVLRELDRALSFHLQWLKGIHRTVICREPPHAEDVAHDAHCRCNFGRWYYDLGNDFLAKEPGLTELEAPHRSMHDAARIMLAKHSESDSVAPEIYESFMNLATDFKQRMRVYQFQLVQRVCSVDQLTGVWNRNSMTMQLAAEAERARRNHESCTLCLLDLDHFKAINDGYGHIAGDSVLQAVARFIKGHLRAYDSLFRYGGEEFLLCLPNTGIETAEPLINRLREHLADYPIELPNHGQVHITASFGVAALAPNEEITLAIERADHALLCAKTKGRNRVCVWTLTGTAPPVGAGSNG